MDDVHVDGEAQLSTGHARVHSLQIEKVERSVDELPLEVRCPALEGERPDPLGPPPSPQGQSGPVSPRRGCLLGALERIDNGSGGDPVGSEHPEQPAGIGRQKPRADRSPSLP